MTPTRAREPTIAVVTGAAGAIGRTICDELAARGTRLVLIDRNARGLEDVRSDLPDGARSTTVAADLHDPQSVERAALAALAAFDGADVLVNGAGIEGPVAPIEDVPFDDLRAVFEVNVFAMARLIQLFVPHFRTRSAGRVVNLASGAGLAGSGMMAAYSASKHAVVGLTRSVAIELAPIGIPVNAVCPGCVDSPMMRRIEAQMEPAANEAPFAGAIPAGRYAHPAEVASLVAYLALDAPTYLTGAALVLDGAFRA